RRGVERPVVLQDVGVVGELRRGADVVPEDVFRHRDAGDLRKVIDQGADEVRLRRPLLHRFREILVLRLLRITGLGHHLLRRDRDRGNEDRYANGKAQPGERVRNLHQGTPWTRILAEWWEGTAVVSCEL